MLRAGIEIKNVSVVGGGAQSLYWGKIISSVLNRPLIYSKDRTLGAALGAARLAWLAKEINHAFAMPAIEAVIEPEIQLTHLYQAKYTIFCELYKCLKNLFNVTLYSQSVEEMYA